MYANNCQWPGERSKKAVGIHEVDPIMSLSAQVVALANQIASFTTRDAASRESTMVVSSSSYSGDGVGLDTEQCQFVIIEIATFGQTTIFRPIFIRGLRNHENFSYANPRNALQPPPGYP